jgi:hypothetical protein
MGIYHPLRRVGTRVTLAVLCLLLLNGFAPKVLPGGLLKLLFGWNWLPVSPHIPARLSKESLSGALCAVGYLREAFSRVDNERELVRAEYEAFTEFAESVRAMDAAPQQSFDASTATLASVSPGHDQLQTIRDRYRDTVMDIPEYDAEYGETIRENMTAEFGEDLATAVLDGGQFTPQLKNLLVTQATTAANQRRTLLEALDDEYDSLDDVRFRLDACEMDLEDRTEIELSKEPFETLVEYDHRSRQNEARCRTLLVDRQRDIHGQTRLLPRSDAVSLQEYLYHDLRSPFPALRAGLERLKQLRERRRIVARVIARLD